MEVVIFQEYQCQKYSIKKIETNPTVKRQCTSFLNVCHYITSSLQCQEQLAMKQLACTSCFNTYK